MIRFICFATVITFPLGCTSQPNPTTQPVHDEIVIPFTLTKHNNFVVNALFNNQDSLNLMLHTASSDLRITEDAVRKSKSITFTDSSKVKSWGGESDSRFSKGNRLQIGTLVRTIDLWEDKNSGHETDGKFGLDFFEKRIVEIDFDQSRLVIHQQLPGKAESYEQISIENQNGQLLIPGTCLIDGQSYVHQFLLHTGYSGGILLDDAFAQKTGVDGKIKITEESSLKDSFGNTIKVKKGILPGFKLGRSQILNVPAGFFSGAIGNQKMSVMGCDVIKQFNIIFDVTNHHLYISPRAKP